jgi:serine/threonine protein kinase
MNAEALIGTVLGTCTLQQLIGQGSMGAVFLAQQSRPHRQVAVKVLLPMMQLKLEQHIVFLERFQRETDAVASLDHPNILPVHEYGECDGLAYIVMPYISGGTLRDELEGEKQLSWSRIVSYLDQMAAALNAAHARGVIHRDIKPANILRTPEKRLLLSDFGLARLICEGSNHQASQTTTTMPMGTPEYMAPEQVVGYKVDACADLYSLGVILYQMVTGTVPFKGEGPMQVAMQHLHRIPPSPRQLRPDLPPAAEQVILRALAKRPEDRFPHAQALAGTFRISLIAAGIVFEERHSGELVTPPIRSVPSQRLKPHRLLDPAQQTRVAQEALPPPSRSSLRRKGDLRRLTSLEGTQDMAPLQTMAPSSSPEMPSNGVPSFSVSSAATQTPFPPGASRMDAVSPPPVAMPTDAQSFQPLPGQLDYGMTGLLTLPRGYAGQGMTTTMRLTQSVKVVRMPVAGQPGRYVTGLLHAPTSPLTPTPEVAAPTRPDIVRAGVEYVKRNRKLVALLAVAFLLVVGSNAFWLLHSHTLPNGQMAQPGRTPTPNLTATAAIQATATADANIILTDPLSQNIHDWPVSTNAKGPQMYVFKNGAYHITDTDTKSSALALLPPDEHLPTSFVYTLTMEEIKGDDTSINNQFGMVFRLTTHQNNGRASTSFYTFDVANTPGGEYQFWKYDDSYGPSVDPWTKLWSQPFGKEYHYGHGAAGRNTFRVILQGPKFTFIVNGKKVGNTQDDTLQSGQIGMLVNWDGTEVAFSNLALTYQ